MPDSSPDTPLQDQTVASPLPAIVAHPPRTSILLFCAATFFFWAALYLYVPVLPVYAQTQGASLTMVGVVVSSYAIAQLLLRIPIGIWTDALQRRKLIVGGGLIVASLGALGLGVAPSPWWLFLARALTGVAAATWVSFAVFFAAYYPRERTARAIGIISFVNGIALVAATSSGGVVAELWGYKPTFFGAALLGLLGLVALAPARQPTIVRTQTLTVRSVLRVATHPLLLTVSAMSILLQFATFAGIFGFILVYGAEIGASSADLGVITMLALGSSAAASLAAVYAAERWGYPATILLGALLLGVALLSVPFIKSVGLLEAVQVVNGVGRGLLTTILMALSIRAVAPEQRATAMGVYQALYSIGMLTGPLVSGALAESLGLASVFYLSSTLCLVIVAMAYLPVLPRR